VVKPAALPQVGDAADIYLRPVVKDFGSARWVDMEILGVWYRNHEATAANPPVPPAQGDLAKASVAR
jgi:hypothetical protein